MRHFARRPRTWIAIGASALISGGLVAAPATASVTTQSVTILLSAPNQTGLDKLSTAQGLTHAQRIAALAKLVPSAAAHRAVEAELTRAGFTVTNETAWTITASAPSNAVAATFGTTGEVAPTASPLAKIKSDATLPTVPSSIASLTAVALPTTGGPAVFTPQVCAQCHDGNDFRNAYTAPNVAPKSGKDANGALTIATLQFAGWNDSDLTKYAASVGLPDPVASGQYTQIPVGQASVPAASTSEQGADEEVDLDQESILSTDPTANQRAYFANQATVASYVSELSQVYADVTQSTGEKDGGDPKIAALSTSWGACEDEFPDAFNHSTTAAVENILKALTAAGVTVFAASGDDGVYDCGIGPSSTSVAVDYPAASPEVVAVGGTKLKYVGNSAANTGTNWTDTGWTCKTSATCQGTKAGDTGGSGGGESTLFKLPAYQKAGIASEPFTTSTGKKGNFGTQPHRLVPDIADEGDPDTGFTVLTTDPTDVKACAPPLGILTCQPKSILVGGTSLSSPVAASLLTAALGSHGSTAGVGDIHDALYSAYAAHRGAFRDVTSGSNGKQSDVDRHAAAGTGYELPVTAEKGYDTVTGLGAPLWPRIATYLFDKPVAPIAKASIKLSTPHSATNPRTVTAHWKGDQATTAGSAPSSATVTIQRAGSASPVYHSTTAAAEASKTFTATSGGNYTVTVIEHDLAGQSSKPVTATVLVPYDDKKFTFSGDWRRVAGASDFGGSRSTTDSAGARATIVATGQGYSLEVRTGPTLGKLAIYHGQTKLGTYSLYSARVTHRLIPFFGRPSTHRLKRTFSFRYTGHKSAQSTGTTVDVDALYVVH